MKKNNYCYAIGILFSIYLKLKTDNKIYKIDHYIERKQ